MTYLAEKQFVHRGLATRNCMYDRYIIPIIYIYNYTCTKYNVFCSNRISNNKGGRFWTSWRYMCIYFTHYYRQASSIKLPIKWMSLESINDEFLNRCGWWIILTMIKLNIPFLFLVVIWISMSGNIQPGYNAISYTQSKGSRRTSFY